MTGDTALGNGSKTVNYPVGPAYSAAIGGGVVITGGDSDNLVGTSGQRTTTPASATSFRAPQNDGVNIYGSGTSGNVIAGNFIGTNAAGTAAVGNGGDGVYMEVLTSTNWIGVNPVYGPEKADEGNVISGNGAGMQIGDSTGQVVAGNLIGTNAAGTAAIPDGLGVQISDSTHTLIGTSGQTGPADALERNVISENSGVGVWITYVSNGSAAGRTANVVAGNDIGTNAAGTAAVANTTTASWSTGAYGNWIGVDAVSPRTPTSATSSRATPTTALRSAGRARPATSSPATTSARPRPAPWRWATRTEWRSRTAIGNTIGGNAGAPAT